METLVEILLPKIFEDVWNLDTPLEPEAVMFTDYRYYINTMQMCKPQRLVQAPRKPRKSCRLQNNYSPLKIVRASYQYMYDDTNLEYLDCVNSVAHVGHCHPAVVKAASVSMESAVTSCGWEIDYGDLQYPKELHQFLPTCLNTFLFCNSGSEAVDLALQLSRLYTNGTDAIVVDNAFHGSIDSVHQLSPKVFKCNNIIQPDWVHTVAMPDLYRGPYQEDDPLAVEKYIADARDMIDKARHYGRKIACFIAEPMLTVPGCIIPPNTWLQGMYRMVREFGGLCIADEVQTSLGRVGSHFWSFQAQGVTPDILIIGKSVGNGYPMASVVTSREVAALLGERIKEYQCTKMMNAVGCAVLEVLQQEHLMGSASVVGSVLKDELLKLQQKHEYIGQVRGKGLMFGIEIVWSKQSKKPSKEIADHIVFEMKKEYVIMANEGNSRNILLLMPPMCFTQENALLLVKRLDKVLSAIPSKRFSRSSNIAPSAPVGICEGRLGTFQPQEDDDDDGTSSMRDTVDLECAQHSYQDLD
ncbi:5-phosphohydroxy-L-lysine phospho-lyase-like isoform X2 [Homarus americanus]|uniref:5-phosphohydroxy-L-lysine phospho-lyase-like isoform X2 n=1 Tax=Homarus americanus TaxID=6706 RepID=UPI001C4628EE|nr:5-phosphohydroxy-L-lysine phospho-lyase-like isoform X2 [Homarus americanus]